MGPRRAGRAGHGRAALPAGRRRGEDAVRRREAPRRALQAAARQARHSPARRADQPSRRRERRLARASFARLSRHRDHGHPRPLLPRQHHRMDARARSRGGHSLQGQLLVLARAEERSGSKSRASRTRRASGRLARELDWIRASPKARQAKSKARIRAYDELLAEAGARQDRQGADHHPAGPAPRRRGDRGRSSGEGLRRQAAHRRSLLQAAARRHCRRDRAERRRQDHAVPHDRRPGQAR